MAVGKCRCLRVVKRSTFNFVQTLKSTAFDFTKTCEALSIGNERADMHSLWWSYIIYSVASNAFEVEP